LVDVKNTILFLEALKQASVPVEAHLFEKGDHGFFLIPRDRWQVPIMKWLRSNGRLLVVLCRSRPRSGLVKSDAICGRVECKQVVK
jgi:acetyl esterase/lipase